MEVFTRNHLPISNGIDLEWEGNLTWRKRYHLSLAFCVACIAFGLFCVQFPFWECTNIFDAAGMPVKMLPLAGDARVVSVFRSMFVFIIAGVFFGALIPNLDCLGRGLPPDHPFALKHTTHSLWLGLLLLWAVFSLSSSQEVMYSVSFLTVHEADAKLFFLGALIGYIVHLLCDMRHGIVYPLAPFCNRFGMGVDWADLNQNDPNKACRFLLDFYPWAAKRNLFLAILCLGAAFVVPYLYASSVGLFLKYGLPLPDFANMSLIDLFLDLKNRILPFMETI